MPDVGGIAGERLKSFIERIEQLEEENAGTRRGHQRSQCRGQGHRLRHQDHAAADPHPQTRPGRTRWKRNPCSTSTSARSASCPTRPRRRKPRNNADSHPLRSVILLAPAYSPDAPQARHLDGSEAGRRRRLLRCRRKVEMSPCAQSRDNTAVGGGADKLGVMVSLCCFAIERVSGCRFFVRSRRRFSVPTWLCGASRAVAVKAGPSDARATAEGVREAVLTAVSTASASARSGRGCLRPEQPQP
jgi:hypothetical protein